MLRIIVMVCAVNTPVQDCSRNTAIKIIRGVKVVTPMQCGLTGLREMAPQLAEYNEYARVTCERESVASK